MMRARVLQDILAQPESLARVVDYQTTEGRGAMAEVACRLRAGRPILVSGMGASLYAAMPFAYQLAEAGLPATVVETSELLHYQPEVVRNAVIVLISRSGDTVETQRLLPLLKERGACIAGVTNEPASTLAREADYTILVGSRRDEMVAVQTYTGTVAALLMLGCAVSNSDCRRGLDCFIAGWRPALERHLMESDRWRPFFADTPVVYLVGRGPSLGSAHEGALLFHELAKMPAVAMSSGGFRHGPVEAVDANFRGLIFATQPRTERLEIALAGEIARFGGSAVLVGGREIPDSLPSWPVVAPGCLLPLAEIAPVQIAACRLAEWRGLTPGQFRFASQVTSSEESFECRTYT
jgi:glucosamine--fructose-6-phosphate aminotransferase (isomerizing)